MRHKDAASALCHFAAHGAPGLPERCAGADQGQLQRTGRLCTLLHQALTQPYPAYEQLGIRNPGGDYNQLGTSLLQIENEFYGTIRPKRTTRSGERPLHALRERGVEYVEVRLMDIDPFEPLGISASTMRMLDVFLLHCLLSDSPEDSPEEIETIKRNQHLVAERGREPGLKLQRGAEQVLLSDWAKQVLDDCQPLAAMLDELHQTDAYSQALAEAQQRVQQPGSTPSARVLEQIRSLHQSSFERFGRAQSLWAHEHLLALPWVRHSSSITRRWHRRHWMRRKPSRLLIQARLKLGVSAIWTLLPWEADSRVTVIGVS